MLKRYLVIVAVICLGVTAAAFDVRQIVVPDNPAAVEKYAAELLANYLEKVFNRRFPIVRSSVLPSKGSCCVGPFFAEKGLKKFPRMTDEESLGKSFNGRLFLTGNKRDSRGTLYAVYEFLERELGIRFYTPVAEKVPQRKSFDFSRVDFRFAPAFPLGRNVLRLLPPEGMSEDKYYEFLSKSRINTVYGMDKVDSRFAGFWRSVPHDGDSMHIFIPAAKYYNSNPEFFALVNGKRENSLGRGGMKQPQVCFSNPELRKTLLKEVRAYWKACGAPKETFLRITNNDNDRICQCAPCRKINKEEGSHAGIYLRVINEIAREMAKEYPDIKILANAYWTTRVTPKITRPEKNVYLKFCDIEGTFSRKLDDPVDPVNKGIYRDIRNWGRLDGKLYATTYTTNFTFYLYPINDYDTFPYNLRLYHRHGAQAFQDHTSWHVRGIDFEEWRYYLAARLMRDPGMDEHAERKEFFKFYYGPGYQAAESYYQLIRSAAKQHKYQTGCFFLFPSFYDINFQKKAAAIFEKGLRDCGKNKLYADRLAKERVSLLFMECSSGALFESYPVEKQIRLLNELKTESRRFGIKKRSNRYGDTLEKWADGKIRNAKQILIEPGKSFLVKADLVSGGKKVKDMNKDVIKLSKFEKSRIIRSYSACFYTADPDMRYDVAVRIKTAFVPGKAKKGHALAVGWEPGFRNQPDGMEVGIRTDKLPENSGYVDIPVMKNVHARTAYSYFYIKPVFSGDSGIKYINFEGFVLTPVKATKR